LYFIYYFPLLFFFVPYADRFRYLCQFFCHVISTLSVFLWGSRHDMSSVQFFAIAKRVVYSVISDIFFLFSCVYVSYRRLYVQIGRDIFFFYIFLFGVYILGILD